MSPRAVPLERRVLGLLIALSLVLGSAAIARPQAPPPPASQPQPPVVRAVGAIGVTVSDLDRAIEFYSTVLSFEKVSDVEVAGEAYEHLQGVFGLRMRVVRMRLGDEVIELTQYLAPQGRPIPVESRSNDRWFQHIAVIVNDMDRVYALFPFLDIIHAYLEHNFHPHIRNIISYR